MSALPSITIKELHARTGPHVRRAAKSPVKVTDRGKFIAVLVAPHLLTARRRPRTLLPEFQRMMRRKSGDDLAADLDAVRGER